MFASIIFMSLLVGITFTYAEKSFEIVNDWRVLLIKMDKINDFPTA